MRAMSSFILVCKSPLGRRGDQRVADAMQVQPQQREHHQPGDEHEPGDDEHPAQDRAAITRAASPRRFHSAGCSRSGPACMLLHRPADKDGLDVCLGYLGRGESRVGLVRLLTASEAYAKLELPASWMARP